MLSKIAYTFLLLLFLNACTDNNKESTLKIELQGKTMGTQYHISAVSPPGLAPDKQKLKSNVDQILGKVNQQMSTYIADSEISKFNQTAETDWILVSDDFLAVVKAAEQVSTVSGGAFDISISPLVDLWGFGPDIKVKTPNEKVLREVKSHIGFRKLELQDNPPALKKTDALLRIDLSAVAKGFAVDEISRFLSEQGIANHLVEIGGEVRTSGKNHSGKAWRVAIEIPEVTGGNRAKANKTLELSNQAVATSGDYRNYYVKNGESFSHIINPKSGEPIKHKLASVTVIHNSAMMADALATALMVMGEKRGRQFAKEQELRVYMIIREQEAYTVWSTLD